MRADAANADFVVLRIGRSGGKRPFPAQSPKGRHRPLYEVQGGFAQSQPVENSPMLVSILPKSGEPDETFRLRARRNGRCLDSSNGSALTRCRL